MHIAKNEVPAKIDVPGAVARQATRFGEPGGYSGRWRADRDLGARGHPRGRAGGRLRRRRAPRRRAAGRP